MPPRPKDSPFDFNRRINNDWYIGYLFFDYHMDDQDNASALKRCTKDLRVKGIRAYGVKLPKTGGVGGYNERRLLLLADKTTPTEDHIIQELEQTDYFEKATRIKPTDHRVSDTD